tara:strand:+ start:247 stop:984 length:738 start_codon:yes stop_codon:yes gene_type:complete
MNKTAIIIPSRMSASRLAGKPLLKINDLPIICHVVNKAQEANIGEVYVATEDQEIVDAVKENGGKAVLTGKHATGSDRIFEGYKKLNLTGINYLINLQGDEPMINPEDIINLNNKMIENNINIGTLGADFKNGSLLENENVVKVVTEKKLDANNFAKAKNFFRKNANENNLNVYHHIGVYAYNVSTLEKFISLQQTKNEIQKRLEQLRALDNNIEIMVVLAKSSPIGVDTKEDFLAIKKIMEYKS